MKKIFFLLFIVFLYDQSVACRYTVREIGFADFGTDQYALYFYKDQNTTEEQATNFRKISFAALLDANIVSEIIDVRAQSDHPAMKFYKSENPDNQLLALVAADGRFLNLTIDRNSSNFKEEIWSVLELVVSSSVREQVLSQIVGNYGIVVFVEGQDESENKAALQKIQDAMDEIKIMMKNMEKPVEQPPVLIVIPATEIENEKILLWALGWDDIPHAKPGITVLYGRGRQMGRLLPSDIINSNIIKNLLAFVGADCECGLDRSWILGRMIPIRWDSDRQAEIVKWHNFDAENPLIKAEMSQILSISPNKERTSHNADLSTNNLYGYTEKEFELVEGANSDQSGSTFSFLQKYSKPGLLIVLGFVLFVLLGGGVVFFRSHRRNE